MIEEIISEFESGSEKSLENLKSEFSKIRTGRATASLLDSVRVDYYGTPSPLMNIAQISVLDARTLQIKPFDRSASPEIEKAIQKSDLGLTPQSDGDVIRISVPALNEERRTQLVKQTKTKAEEARIAVRNQRRDSNDMIKALEKDKEISKDDMHSYMDQIQKLTDQVIKKVDEMLSDKEKNILEI